MAIRIHHLRGSQSGETQSFDGDAIRLGRHPECDVRFHPKRDRGVSGHHGEIRRENGAWCYLDRRSSNGSFVGGERVERVPLAGGEEIELGRGGPLVRVELSGAARTEALPAGGRPGAPSPASPSPSPAPPGSAPVGNRTVGMMIQAAMARSRDQRTGKVPTATFIRAVASEAVRSSSRTFKVVVVVVIVFLLGAVGLLVFELQRTRRELDELAISKLGPSELGEWIGANYGQAVFLLVYRTNLGYEQGFCTAFAVAADRLMTNAHCVAQMERLATEGASFFAAQDRKSVV